MEKSAIKTHKVRVPVVVGGGCGETLVVSEIPLWPPVFELKDIDKTVIVEHCQVITGKVIINGILRKNINFKTYEKADKCHNMRLVCGSLRHCMVEIPFSLFIEVAGAREGDDCQVERAFVEGETDQLLEPTQQGNFTKLLEKAIIRVEVKVTRTEQISVYSSSDCAGSRN